MDSKHAVIENSMSISPSLRSYVLLLSDKYPYKFAENEATHSNFHFHILNCTIEKAKRTAYKCPSEKFLPNRSNKSSHGIMSGPPNLPIVVQQKPFILKCLHKNKLNSQIY